MLGHVEVSTGDDLTDIAVVRAARPNLLTSDDPLFAVALGLGSGGGGMFTRVIEMVKYYGLEKDPVVRDALADLIIHNKVAGFNNQRAMDKIKSGQIFTG